MSALGDALGTKNRESVLASRIEIAVDSVGTEATVTYSVRLESPSYSQVVLSAQSDVEVAAAVAEYTAWATNLWS